jgi:energy-coupling factor transporter ATP-binding protein EcfA2
MRLFGSPTGPTLTLGTAWTGVFPRRLTLPPAVVATHKHVIGLSGSGKSTLLASMAVALIRQGVGVAVVDPHADLVAAIAAGLVESGYFNQPGAAQKLLYVDFSDPGRHLPFNVLNKPTASPHQVAQEIDEVCKRAWAALADGAAPQFENILLSSVVVLAENGLALTDLQRLLTDRDYRDGLLTHVTDPQIIEFFHARFDRWGREQPTMLESTLRRVFLLTFSPTLRYSLGQKTNALDFRRFMDEGTSVLFNLGGLDEATQQFLGCLLTVGFETAALSRANQPASQRRQYHLFLDEFSQFSATSEQALARVLSLCRKYGLFLTLAHQTWSQLSSRLAGALQNTVEIAFRLGPDDARWAAPRFGSYDPQQTKLVGEAGKEYPLSVQETDKLWTNDLERLKTGEAFVAVGKDTTKIRARMLKSSNTAHQRAQTLCQAYSDQLLVPRAQVQPTIDVPAPTAPRTLKRAVPSEKAA